MNEKQTKKLRLMIIFLFIAELAVMIARNGLIDLLPDKENN